MNRDTQEDVQYQPLSNGQETRQIQLFQRKQINNEDEYGFEDKHRIDFKEVEEKNSKFELAIYIGVIITMVIGEYFFREPLYQLTLDIVPSIQKQLTAPVIYWFKFVTLFGYGHVAAILFALAYAFSTREKAFYLIFVHTVAGIMNQELKIIYHNPRPYMSSDDVQAISCSKSFGNPSGHSSLSSCFYISLFLLIFHSQNSNRPTYKYYLSLFLLITLIINVGISRIALGVHSLNQILYGWSYGAWEAFFMFRYISRPLMNHIKNLESDFQERQTLLIQRQHRQIIDKREYAMKALVIWFGIIVFSIISTQHTKSTFSYPQEWLDRIVEKCSKGKPLNYISMFVDSAFIKIGLVSSIFGAYFGILYDSTYLQGTKASINDTSFKKGIYRLIIGGLVASPLILPYFILSEKLGIVGLFLFKTTIPFFILLFFVFSWLKLLFKRLNLVN